LTRNLLRALFGLPAMAALLSLAACGGGGSNGSSSSSPPQNTQSIVVDGGPADIPNIAFTSVTICAPGSSTNCQTIDHVQIDTGSSGLRIISSVLSASLGLPQQTDAGGGPLAECVQFADGFSWGSVKIADIRIAGELAGSVPIQVIGDPGLATIPASCSNVGPPENTVAEFGANGLLGVGLFLQDCGSACAQAAIPGTYYACPTSACQPVQAALAKQVQNPVALFGSDNNGVIVQLPAVPASGAMSVTGSIIFGIGTQSNNGLGSAKVLATDPNTGTIVTTYNGQVYANSYIDSGSSLIFFGTNAFPICTGTARGFYCPTATQNLAATLQGGAQSAGVNFSVANANGLFAANPSFNSFDDLAAPSGDAVTFAWGLSFFYGRSVFTAIEQRNTPGGQGPYFAF
jgi:uncharacterized protein DUF3443